jgi:hypothetical protein
MDQVFFVTGSSRGLGRQIAEQALRLLVGSDAYEYGREAWRHRIETDEKWEPLSRSADHDEAGGAWQRQRGSSLPDLPA